MIQVIKLKPDKESAFQDKLNKRMAPKVNMIYALSIIIEGLAVDLKEEKVRETAILLRSKVNEANKEVAPAFGEWTDTIEELLLDVAPKDVLLPVLCEKIYIMSRNMEADYRSYDPNFDFYQKNEVLELRKRATDINTKVYQQASEVIKQCMIA